MVNILNIKGEPIFDDRVIKIETHVRQHKDSDEIRIPIQQQDLYTLSCKSFLYVERRLIIKRVNDESQITLGNNCVAFMFDKIRQFMNSMR